MNICCTESQKTMEGQLGVFMIALVLLLLLVQSGLAQEEVRLNSSIERSALLDLRASLGLRGKDWPIKGEPCKWVGVECSNGRVIGITISELRRTHEGKKKPMFAVDSLVNLTSLVYFNASGFYLPGSIPDWFGQSLNALQVLDLRSASILGPIPSSLSGLSRLTQLHLSHNSLTGSIPSSLGQLEELSVLNLSQNALTGLIPSGFSSLVNLTRLDLSSNFLSGPIPPGLGNLSRLQFLSFSDNSLAASIPVQLGDLARLLVLNLSKNSLSGSLPLELSGLRSLRRMDIGDNSIEGQLPEALFSNLSHLQVVVLRGNKLDGELPVALLSILSLQILDVSSNNFTGSLPSLSTNGTGAQFNLSNNMLYGNLTFSLSKFSWIDLSSNYFQGKVPEDSQGNVTVTKNCLQTKNQRSWQDCNLFYTQRDLPFDPMAPESQSDSKSHKRLIFILVGIFGGIFFIVLLVVVLLVLRKICDKDIASQRGNANVGPVPGDSPSLPKDPSVLCVGESFSYEQMLHFTSDFSETNLIKHGHSGDLFKGFLESGMPVVIKKVDLRSFKKESYMMEMEFFSKVSHVRFVPLLGHCLEHESEKFFVYKYLPNGDLENSLHRNTSLEDDRLQSQDWITRLKIAIGAAEALAYLHHDCTPPLVHRDIQASSILLDDKFEVRLGSLSEVHAQEGDANQNVLTRLLRKSQTSEQGPSAPLPGTCAHDVYCFGKVLLELVTGKLGISKADDASTREWLDITTRCISIYDKELVTKIVDPSLIIDEDLLEEVWAMAIVARSCLNPKPSKRPPMKYILKALENPLKVVRMESSSSAKLRTTSSRRSWSAVFFGSWQHSSSESGTAPGNTNRDSSSGSKHAGKVGSQGSGGNRLSNEIFPEPVEMQDVERQDSH